jgi:hypothetical protein
MNGVGQYIGGQYVSLQENAEYNRRLNLFNTVARTHLREALVEDIIADANKLEDFLLGRK